MKTAKLFERLRQAASLDRIYRPQPSDGKKKLRQEEFPFAPRRQANDDRPIVHRGCPND